MTLAMVPYRLALFPPLRVAWLRLLGAFDLLFVVASVYTFEFVIEV